MGRNKQNRDIRDSGDDDGPFKELPLGKEIKCSACDGRGWTMEMPGGHFKDGDMPRRQTCSRCSGRGYVSTID